MAGDLRDILNDIRAQHGRLTPATVVQAAEDVEHPLHHRFEWDNEVAGGKWRLHQAGQLLRVKITHDRGDRDPVELRAFWPVRLSEQEDSGTDSPDTEYIPTEEALQNPVARQVMLNQMRRDWQTFRRRYEHMQEFSEVIVGDMAQSPPEGNGDDRQSA